MRLLSSSNSLAFVHSLRIALDGEGIETYCTDADTVFSGVAGPMTGSAARLYVLHEEDWDRAVALMQLLAGPPQPKAKVAAPGRSPMPTWLLIGIGVLLVVAIGGVLSN